MSETPRASIVAESPVWLEVDGARHARWTATPAEFEALAAGRLLTDGFIAESDDIRQLEIVEHSPAGTWGLRASVADSRRAFEARRHLAAHGCGVLGLFGCLGRIVPRQRPAPPASDSLRSLLGALFNEADVQRGERGGMHAAGIILDGALRVVVSDVSRHSAVDKALGHALLLRMPLQACGILTSARISGEIAAKAAIAEVAFVASRSVPTTLAVELAGHAGLPLVARIGALEAEVHGG